MTRNAASEVQFARSGGSKPPPYGGCNFPNGRFMRACRLCAASSVISLLRSLTPPFPSRPSVCHREGTGDGTTVLRQPADRRGRRSLQD